MRLTGSSKKESDGGKTNPAHRKRNNTTISLRTVAGYFIFGVLWILLSDNLLLRLAPPSSSTYLFIQSAKGWLFVGLSALLIYVILKRDIRALEENETHLRNILNAAPDAMVIIKEDGSITLANQQVKTIFGYEPDELIGQAVEILMPERFHEEHRRNQSEHFQTPSHRADISQTLYGLHKDGREFPISIHLNHQTIGGTLFIIASIRDMTEWKFNEDLILESQGLYREMFENNPQPMWVYDLETLAFLMVNDAAVNHYGYSREEFLGMTLKDIRPAEDIPALTANLAQPTQPIEKTTGWRHRKKNGTLIDVEIASHAIQYNGRPARMVLANDVTERKQALDALRESEERFRLTFDNANIGVCLVDLDGRLLRVNAQMCNMLGYSQPVLESMTVNSIAHPDDMDRSPLYIQQAISGQVEHSQFEKRYLHKQGHTVWGQVSSTLIRDKDGNPRYFISHVLDITDRKIAETALRISEENYRSLAETSDSAIAVLNRDGIILYVNPAGIRIWDDPQMVGKTVHDLFPAETADNYLAVIHRVIDEQTVDLNELHAQVRNRAMWFRISMSPLKNPDGSVNALLLNAWDITEQKQAETVLIRNEQRYRALFEDVPVAIWEQDFSAIKKHLEALKAGGVSDFRAYFAEHPEELLFCQHLTRILDVNQTAVRMYEAKDKQELIRATMQDTSQGELENGVEEMIAIATGRTSHSWEGGDETMTGRPIEIRLNWSVVPGYEDDYSRVLLTTVDITERKWAEEAVKISEERYRQTLESMMEGCQIIGFDWRYIYINDAAARQGRNTREALLNRTMMEAYPGIETTEMFATLRDCMENRVTRQIENRFTFPDGSSGWFELAIQPAPEGIFILSFDITERKRAEEALQESEKRYRLLFEDSPVALWEEDFSLVKDYLDSLKARGVIDLYEYFDLHPEALKECAAKVVILDVNKAALGMYGAGSKQELIEATLRNLTRDGLSHIVGEFAAVAEGHSLYQWEGSDETLTGEPIEVSMDWSVVPGHEQDYSRVIVTTIDITERKRSEREIQQRTGELLLINTLNDAANRGEDIETITEIFARETRNMFDCQDVAVYLLSPDGAHLEMQSSTISNSLVEQIEKFIGVTIPRIRIPVREDSYTRTLLNTPQGVISSNPAEIAAWMGEFTETTFLPNALRSAIKKILPQVLKILKINAVITIPLVSSGRTIGLLDMSTRGEFTVDDLQRVRILSHQMTAVILRKQAEASVKVHLQRITALNEIDRAITSSFDMRLSLEVLLKEVTSQLDVDAAAVLLLNPVNQSLEFVAGKGFRSAAIRQSNLRLGEGLAGRAGLERRVVHVANLHDTGVNFSRVRLLKEEEFIEYFGIPLIAKGVLKGVLEIFNRHALIPDPDWLKYLETLGGQAAIAVDNAQMFQDMQRSNQEMTIAYDATIEGWSRAMDLRDEETEGHTRRVTELSLRLAEKMGVSDQERVQMRRGALLHDIGKLGVPDNILLKPGKLTDEEWVIMRQHPTHAYEMLLPIKYLRPALDIPYAHHEKWDGTGYPRGLKGEQIPLAARIFAIVDVWDALRSDRPYRKGWEPERIREHILEQSGKHFDPQVVRAFMELMQEDPGLG